MSRVMKPIQGETYHVDHSRKGKATVKIVELSPDGVWADVEIIDGELRGISRESLRLPGDIARLRISLCRFSRLDGLEEKKG